MNEKKVRELIVLMKEHDGWTFDYKSMFKDPFFDAVGNDRKGLCKFLEGLPVDDLDWISGVIPDIRDKWNDRKMNRFLDKMVKRLTDEGYSFSW